jgi:pimeloyl-ACP methyl ester carboxylesterase
MVLVGANYHHDGLVAMDDFTPTSPGFPAFAQKFGERSPDGAAHAAAVVTKSSALVRGQPTLRVQELRSMSVPVLIISGDDDVVTLTHTVSMYEAFPEAQLAILPGASHAVLKEKTKECVRFIKEFFLGPIPPLSQDPIRRAAHDAKE